MTERDDDRALDAFFAAARSRGAEPSADLLARVLADAEAEQARIGRAMATAPGRPGPRWPGLLDLLGGWGGLGGLVAAGVTGLWIGFSGAGALGTATADLWSGTGAATQSVFATGDVLAMTLVLEEDT